MLSLGEFKAQHGSICPNCQSIDIDYSAIELDIPMWQDCGCNDCGVEFRIIYDITHYDILRTPF